MKHCYLVLLAITLAPFGLFAQLPLQNGSLYENLCQLNPEWNDKSALEAQIPQRTPQNYTELIQLHLEAVENTLRQTTPAGLTATQLSNRNQTLDFLNEYRKRGLFPENHVFDHIHPVFIDPSGTACAVGYLIIKSGNEGLAHTVAKDDNYAYVPDMEFPELGAWAYENGMQVEELAWIQPGYPPTNSWTPLDSGVTGSINTIFTSPGTNLVYAGGDFSKVCANGATSNIGEWDGLQWKSLNGGVNGKINSITEFAGGLIVAGEFTMAGSAPANNIAKWNGASWESLGAGVNGPVNALIEHNGQLYIGGDFTQAGGASANFSAIWDGTNWTAFAQEVDAPIRTFGIYQNELYAGGEFQNAGGSPLAYLGKWNGSSWINFQSLIDAPVNALENFDSKLFIGGPIRDDNSAHKFGIAHWDGTTIDSIPTSHSFYEGAFGFPGKNLYISSLKAYNGRLMAGGRFSFSPGVGVFGTNLVEIVDYITNYGVQGAAQGLDSTIAALGAHNGNVVAGGYFSTIMNDPVNGIAETYMAPLSRNGALSPNDAHVQISPNPSKERFAVMVNTPANSASYNFKLMDQNGKVIKTVNGNAGTPLNFENQGLSAGLYLFEVSSNDTPIANGKVVIQ